MRSQTRIARRFFYAALTVLVLLLLLAFQAAAEIPIHPPTYRAFFCLALFLALCL